VTPRRKPTTAASHARPSSKQDSPSENRPTEDYELVISPWPMFAKDMLLLRFVFRATFAWPKPSAIVQISGYVGEGS
jgi:hypothetical protein